MAEGFDDIEMQNRNNEEEEEDREDREEGETSFGGNNPEDNERASLLDTGNREGQGNNFNRVKAGALSKLKKVTGNIKRAITNDKKESFKKIFNVTLEKKNGENSSILLNNTRFF